MSALTLSRYVAISLFAALAVTWHAFSSRRQYALQSQWQFTHIFGRIGSYITRFFAAMYFLGTSKLSIAILGNFLFMLSLLFYRLVTMVFLGRLRESEVERITERFHHGIVEICLTLTVFRQDFDARLVVLMGILAMVKVFHWLIQDRINYIQSESVITALQHVRIVTFLSILTVLDVLFVRSSIKAVRAGDKGYQLLFMFEYAILACIGCACFVKYGLAVADNATTEAWEHKGLYMLYLELGMDAANFVLYVVFFAMIMHKYTTIPLHLIRDIYMAYMSLWRRVTNYFRYRSVTSKMHQLLDATEADLERVGGSCIICREDMSLSEGLKKLRCGHVFHVACLRSWLERQQTCPICRNSILPSSAAESAEQAPAPAAQDGAAAGAGGLHVPDRAPGGAEAAPAQAGRLADDLADIAPPNLGNPPDAAPPQTQGFGYGPHGTGAGGPADPSTPATPAPGANAVPPAVSPQAGTSAGTGQPAGTDFPFRMAGIPRSGPAPGIRMRTMGLPHEATPETRAAFQAAAKAFSSMAPYYMPIYHPFGVPGSSGPAPDPAASTEGLATGAPASETHARARQVANAAVAASIAATKQLLQGQIALLQERLSSLQVVEEAALREPDVATGEERGGESRDEDCPVYD